MHPLEEELNEPREVEDVGGVEELDELELIGGPGTDELEDELGIMIYSKIPI